MTLSSRPWPRFSFCFIGKSLPSSRLYHVLSVDPNAGQASERSARLLPQLRLFLLLSNDVLVGLWLV